MLAKRILIAGALTKCRSASVSLDMTDSLKRDSRVTCDLCEPRDRTEARDRVEARETPDM